eukprot:TRINITY_DN16515_c0_g1_i2.p1 TRINITY_DN16515_c0_g1~~TRINITY_DN16515_c0_g1_i2.p1  ORF type:complete len:211 (+),score=40.64 TRINITY_DN16515_c0_g1_i2:55-633(+)
MSKKENKNERRLMHIKELMVQKVSKQYTASTGDKVNTAKLAFISDQIENMLASRSPTDQDLNKIVYQLKAKYGRGTSRASGSVVETGRSASLPEVASQEAPASRQAEMTPRQPSSPPLGQHAQRNLQIREDMWARLSKKDQQDYEREEARRKKKAKERMEEQRKALDEQIKQQHAELKHITQRRKRKQQRCS